MARAPDENLYELALQCIEPPLLGNVLHEEFASGVRSGNTSREECFDLINEVFRPSMKQQSDIEERVREYTENRMLAEEVAGRKESYEKHPFLSEKDFVDDAHHRAWQRHESQAVAFLEQRMRSLVAIDSGELKATLTVTVLQGRDLSTAGKRDARRDPYCTVTLWERGKKSKQKLKTPTMKNNQNPVWGTREDFELSHLDCLICVEVREGRKISGVVGGGSLGEARISVTTLLENPSNRFLESWIPLGNAGRKESDAATGEVQLQLQLVFPERWGSRAPPSCDYRRLYKALMERFFRHELYAGASDSTVVAGMGTLSDPALTVLSEVAARHGVTQAFHLSNHLALLASNLGTNHGLDYCVVLESIESMLQLAQVGPVFPTAADTRKALRALAEIEPWLAHRVSEYWIYFPKNEPDNGLVSAVTALRVIANSKGILSKGQKDDAQWDEYFGEPPGTDAWFRKAFQDGFKEHYKNMRSDFRREHKDDALTISCLMCDAIQENLLTFQKYADYGSSAETGVDLVKEGMASLIEDMRNDVITAVHTSPQAAVFTKEQKSNSPEVQLYFKLRELNEFCTEMAGNAFEPFPVCKIFFSAAMRWLDSSVDTLSGVVSRALDAEEWTPLYDDATYSSSVIDSFGAAQRVIDFFMEDLEWEDAKSREGFVDKLMHAVCSLVKEYVTAISSSFNEASGVLSEVMADAGETLDIPTGAEDVLVAMCVRMGCIEETRLRFHDVLPKLMGPQGPSEDSEDEGPDDIPPVARGCFSHMKATSTDCANLVMQIMLDPLIPLFDLLEEKTEDDVVLPKLPSLADRVMRRKKDNLGSAPEEKPSHDNEFTEIMQAIIDYLDSLLGVVGGNMPPRDLRLTLSFIWSWASERIMGLAMPPSTFPDMPKFVSSARLEICQNLKDNFADILHGEGEGLPTKTLNANKQKISSLLKLHKKSPSELIDYADRSTDDEFNGIKAQFVAIRILAQYGGDDDAKQYSLRHRHIAFDAESSPQQSPSRSKDTTAPKSKGGFRKRLFGSRG